MGFSEYESDGWFPFGRRFHLVLLRNTFVIGTDQPKGFFNFGPRRPPKKHRPACVFSRVPFAGWCKGKPTREPALFWSPILIHNYIYMGVLIRGIRLFLLVMLWTLVTPGSDLPAFDAGPALANHSPTGELVWISQPTGFKPTTGKRTPWE